MACKIRQNENNFLRWERFYGDYTILELQAGGIPINCDPADLAPPTTLTATLNGTTQIDLAWNDNSFDETGFEIYRSTVNGFTPSAATLINTTNADITTYNDTGLAVNTFYYLVRALNANGFSDYSNQATATTLNIDITCSVYVDSEDISAEETSPRGVLVTPDGLKMFITGTQVREYDLSVANDITSSTLAASYNPTFSSDDIEFNPDGTKMYLMTAFDNTLYEYDLDTGYDLTDTITLNQSVSFTTDFNSVASSLKGCRFSPDGLKMFLCGSQAAAPFNVIEYTLSISFDISSTTKINEFKLVETTSLFITRDGFQLFVLTNNVGSDLVYQYDLSTAFDMSTKGIASTFNVGTQDAAPQGLYFSHDYAKMYMIGGTNDSVYQYTTICS